MFFIMLSLKNKMVIIVFGLPGSGKSYFASRLAKQLGAVYINSDELRQQLITERKYTDAEKILVYDEMLAAMTGAIQENKTVVLDATFYKQALKNRFELTAKSFNRRVFFIQVTAAEDIIEERVKRPRAHSEADFNVYLKLKKMAEPLLTDHLVLHSTDSNISSMLQTAAAYINNKE
jgi:predicted kinase